MQEHFWTNLCGVNLKVVHWCVNVDDVDVHWCIDVDDKFSKPCKSYLGEDVISSMIEDSKSCSDVMKKRFNKQLVMTKVDNEYFEKPSKCWICDNDYIDTNARVRDHCHITEKIQRFFIQKL